VSMQTGREYPYLPIAGMRRKSSLCQDIEFQGLVIVSFILSNLDLQRRGTLLRQSLLDFRTRFLALYAV
jgi:hypothetical protein